MENNNDTIVVNLSLSGKSILLPDKTTFNIPIYCVINSFHKKRVLFSPDATYEDGEAPICYSNDGIVPAQEVEKKPAEKCSVCPYAAWGSAVKFGYLKGKSRAQACKLKMVVDFNIVRGQERKAMGLFRLTLPTSSVKLFQLYLLKLMCDDVDYKEAITEISFANDATFPLFKFRYVGKIEPLPKLNEHN